MSVRSALASAFRSVATLAVCLLATTPAVAQSVLRDAETEALFRDMAAPLVRAAGLDPKNVDIVLVNDSSINAFVAGGQAVYIHSGLINEASSALEVQGVIAHELGHVVGGHAIDDRGAKMAGNISILSLLLGAAAAAAGGGAAAMGVFMAGQQAAMGKFLAYTRGEEEAADAAGASFLSKAGMSGRGSLEFFHKLLVMENRYGMTHSDEASFYSTHPLTDERIAYLEDVYKKDPAWNAPSDPALEERFQRVKAKLYGYLAEPPSTFQAFPDYMNNVPALYARAYAYHKEGYLDKATGEADKLLAMAPRDPYFLELKGQILLEAGKPAEALGPLRQATALTGNQPLIATTFGHALIAQDDLVNSRAHLDEAQKVLKAAVARDRENPFAWYVLGITYAKSGDLPRARLASAEQASLSGNWGGAMVNAEAAKNGLAAGSPDAIRAEDIALEAKSYLAKSKKR
ncbi:M48 family metalloprotease [Novosphingobium sp. KACC 22771]|uniref:M48 family metalloprotease n=1 Tax=Novosphingobium sp. KACC 22771 TaxID=3025670 RepID=UPI002366FE44|nr:M48 family metalloprotease [Novosphingobium sp. KACC 22771]WDF72809.1 M48 family metalloprotease [Novosphingobium sp. KACC 22771]